MAYIDEFNLDFKKYEEPGIIFTNPTYKEYGALVPEEWFDIHIPGVRNNYYQVSTHGRVRNIYGNILRPSIINSGYLKYALVRKNEKSKYIDVTGHKLVLDTIYPNPNETLIRNHMDGNKTNNIITNLEWVTYSENNLHSMRTGLNNNFGENNNFAKFTNDQVHMICSILEKHNYTSYKDILSMIGVEDTPNNRDMVGNIKRKIAWKSISKDYDI